MVYYYDCFDVNEEEDFYWLEQQESQRRIVSILEQLQNHEKAESSASCLSLDVSLTCHQLQLLCESLSKASNLPQSISFRHWGLSDKGIEILVHDWILSPRFGANTNTTIMTFYLNHNLIN